MKSQKSPRRNYFVALALSVIVGEFGVDRFYMGKIGTGILKLITFGGIGVWWIRHHTYCQRQHAR